MPSSDRTIQPPPTARREKVTERHDHRLVDPYAWLRDPNWQRVIARSRKFHRATIPTHRISTYAEAASAAGRLVEFGPELDAAARIRAGVEAFT